MNGNEWRVPSEKNKNLTIFNEMSDERNMSVGDWVSVKDGMPDDEVSVLVWVGPQEDAVLAYHDTEVLERRKDSGWIEACGRKRVLLGVTHFCERIRRPEGEEVNAENLKG